ncbi:FHA domain-containing protein [Streptomyces sp. YC504]|uniref:FHA domain-containing protein n=1 Tax=Streptomyces mesophilus TaxID=1775132 RepID=A0A6G4XCS2_9ACTN|nr:FHA domain-containing protein [Streptomyces mesophilus]NGO74962.1 FHA domain-containing protein [Streptomyces mesophilus]
MTSSFEFPTYPARVSDAERDEVLAALRDGVAQGRLSHDTFVRRMELALVARRPHELARLTADLPTAEGGRMVNALTGAIGAVSAFTVRVRRAWEAERLPKLLLPLPGPFPLRIGRDPANGLRLSHETVSRSHAELVLQGGIWVLRDLGSTNGTSVNGRRVVGATVVREGDHIAFGSMRFRLSAQ